MNKIIQYTFFAILVSTTDTTIAQTPIFPPPQAIPYAQQPNLTPYNMRPQAAPVNPYSFQQQSQQVPIASNQAPIQAPTREYSGYLGLATDIIPASVRAQLPAGITQGILVKEFAPDSPAINSELKPFDVIYAYGNTKINHPSQFIKLVRDDEPGKTISLKIIHQGQLKDIQITLGSQKTPNPKEFNGLAIKQIGKDTYNALVRFVGANGNKQVRSYKGTRQEIYDQALNAQDLPNAERQQLLYATRPRNTNSNSGFGRFFPFGGKNESGKDWMNPSRFFKW